MIDGRASQPLIAWGERQDTLARAWQHAHCAVACISQNPEHTLIWLYSRRPTVTSLINRHDVARLRRKVELPVHSASAQHQRTHSHDPSNIAHLSIRKIASSHTQTRKATDARIARREEKTSVDMSFYRLMASRRSCTP